MKHYEIIWILLLILLEINCLPDTICLNDCNGKGICVKGECQCFQDYSGMDCSESACPTGINWFDTIGDRVYCSNRGNCKLGKCECDPGFYGDICDSLNVTYKGVSGCSGNGKYVTLNSLTGSNDENEKRIYGCKCKNGYSGKDCQNSISKTCPFGVNITVSEMAIHYSQFEITTGKKALSMKIENGNELIIVDKTIPEIIEMIKDKIDVKIVKISDCTTICEDISDNNKKTLIGGFTYRFTFPLNSAVEVTEVKVGQSVVDSTGIINKYITTYEFTISADKTPTKITITKVSNKHEFTISNTDTIPTIITAIEKKIGVNDVRIYKYDSANSDWEDITTSDSNTLTGGTEYAFSFPLDKNIEVTEITVDDGNVIDGSSIANNEITLSEFTISSAGDAKYIFLEKGNEIKRIDVISAQISDIVSSLTNEGITNTKIYKYESNKWVDKTSVDEVLSNDKYRLIFLTNDKYKNINIVNSVKVIDITNTPTTLSSGSGITIGGSENYYTEANSIFTLTSTSAKLIIQNTKSYSSSLSTIVTDVNKKPTTLYSAEIEISLSTGVDTIISKIIDINIVKLVKVYECDGGSGGSWNEITTGNLDTSKAYKFVFPLDPYAKIADVTTGQSVIDGDGISYEFDDTTPSSSSKFTLTANPSFVSILDNGVIKTYVISTITSSITYLKIYDCSSSSCSEISNPSSLQAGNKYKFTFTNSANGAKVVAVTTADTAVDTNGITVNDKKDVFKDISVFGKSVVISECSGHGTCNREGLDSPTCECKTGYTKNDGSNLNCQLANSYSSETELKSTTICPFGYSWFGINNNIIHGLNECSNQGECKSGKCECDKSGIFIGENCEKLNMKCKNGMKLEEKPVNDESKVFEYINMKCDCGSLYSGNDCNKPSCPYGPISDHINSDHKLTKTPPYYILKCPNNPDPKTTYRFEFTNVKRNEERSRKLRSGYTPKYWRKMLERIRILKSEVIITDNPDQNGFPTMDYSETTKKYSICGGDRPNDPSDTTKKIKSYRIFLPGYCKQDLTPPLGLKLIKENSENIDKDKDITLEFIGEKDTNVISCSECSGNGECNRVTRTCKCNSGYKSSNIKYDRPNDDGKGVSLVDSGVNNFISKFSLEEGMKGDCSYKPI